MARFRQRDVERALRAMLAAGVRGRVEIATDGRIIIVPVTDPTETDGPEPESTGPKDIVL
jgi:hypothetical protein